MENLNEKINGNIKYKFAIVVLSIICVIMAVESLIIIKNVNTRKTQLSGIDNKLNKKYINKKIQYNEIINSLNEMNNVKILDFNNDKVKDIITINLEIIDNKKNIQNDFTKIEKIKGFYNIASIKTGDYKDENKDGTFKIQLSVNFTKDMKKEV